MNTNLNKFLTNESWITDKRLVSFTVQTDIIIHITPRIVIWAQKKRLHASQPLFFFFFWILQQFSPYFKLEIRKRKRHGSKDTLIQSYPTQRIVIIHVVLFSCAIPFHNLRGISQIRPSESFLNCTVALTLLSSSIVVIPNHRRSRHTQRPPLPHHISNFLFLSFLFVSFSYIYYIYIKLFNYISDRHIFLFQSTLSSLSFLSEISFSSVNFTWFCRLFFSYIFSRSIRNQFDFVIL